MIKKIFTVFTALTLVIAPFSSIFAKSENTNKEEIVYISTSIEGKVRGVYVVNAFDIDKNQKILDYGQYEKITNLTSLNNIEQYGDMLTVEANSGKFFYQGDNPNKELPWNINFEYYLNGIKKESREIVGSSGEVKIIGDISINDKANPLYGEYYLGQLSINIDSNKAIVKDAKDSTIAYEGSIQKLNYTILPEKELSFEILTDATSFEMQPFNFSAIPFNMNFDLPDTTSLTDNLELLEDGIRQLDDGASSLSSGLLKINDNTALLYNAVKKLNSGLSLSAKGQSDLASGSKQFQNGLEQYSQGIDQLVNKIGEIGSGIGELKFGLSQLKDGSGQLTSGVNKYSTGVEKYVNGVTELESGHKELTSGIQQIADNSNDIKSGGSQLVDGSKQIYDGLEMLDRIDISNLATQENLDKLGSIIEKTILFWDEAEKIVYNIDFDKLIDYLVKVNNQTSESSKILQTIIDKTDIETLTENLNIVDTENEDVKKLLAKIKSIQNQIIEAKNKIDTANKYITSLSDIQERIVKLKSDIKQQNIELRVKLAPLKEALKEYDKDKVYSILQELGGFRSQYKKFHYGLVEYTNGTNKIIDGISNDLLPASKKFDEGLSKLSSNGSKLISSTKDLYNGSKEITNGLDILLSQLNFGDLNQVNQLKTGMDQLVKNYAIIQSGQEELSDGLDQLSTGMNKYTTGFSQFDAGMNQLVDGAKQLNNGTSQLESETNGMSKEAQIKIDEALKAFQKEDFKLKSFISDKNTNINLVQFVYVSDALVKEKENGEVEPVKKMSFFEKVWDIITFWD